MASSSSTYSFWLVPPQGTPARDRTQRLIDALTARHGAPRFVPHVTLAGGFKASNSIASGPPSSTTPSSSDATLAARALAASHPAFSRPLKVKLESISSGSEYHRCVYALAEVSEELVAAAAAAGEAALAVEAAISPSPSAPFRPDETFMPHLSLLYSSDGRAREEGLAEARAEFAEAFREEEEATKQEDGNGVTEAAGGCCLSWPSSEIEVWLTEGRVEDWRCEARVPFGKKA